MNTKELGEIGEDIACDYLEGKGYKILERNFKAMKKFGAIFGELDIIAKKKDIISFVEVKALRQARSGALSGNEDFAPEDRVDFQKQKKLVKLAQIWLSKNRVGFNVKWQIDVIGIRIARDGEEPEIRHFENAVSG